MYKYIDDACINMNVYREKRVEEYLCLCFMFYVEGRQKQTELFPSKSISSLQRSFKISHILASFWACIDLV